MLPVNAILSRGGRSRVASELNRDGAIHSEGTSSTVAPVAQKDCRLVAGRTLGRKCGNGVAVVRHRRLAVVRNSAREGRVVRATVEGRLEIAAAADPRRGRRVGVRPRRALQWCRMVPTGSAASVRVGQQQVFCIRQDIVAKAAFANLCASLSGHLP